MYLQKDQLRDCRVGLYILSVNGKAMKTETEKILDRLLLKDLYLVWEHVRSGELKGLDELDQQLAGIMLEHKDAYFEGFENPSAQTLEECGPENDTDPYMHVIFHTVIEHQLQTGDVSQIEPFYESMRQLEIPRHDIMHLIGCFLSELLYEVIVEDQPFDQQRYETLLRRYIDQSPEKVLEGMENGFE